MVESSPSVIKKAASKASRTARASRLCAGLGDKLERMKGCCSGTTTVVFTIGATLRGRCNARREADTASPLASRVASVRRYFCPLGQLRTSNEASRPLKRPDGQGFQLRRE